VSSRNPFFEHVPATGGHQATDIAAVLRRWQHHLLDLSRRNRLLFFKPGRSAVRIVDEEPDRISEALGSARGLSFDYAERRANQRSVFSVEDQETSTVEPEVVIRPGDLSSDCPPLDLQRRLKTLQRKDREWEQEQGINVLFLVLGLLHWIDEDGAGAEAPLLLLPCRLRRKSPKDPFYLHREADEPDLNQTLAHRLSQAGIEVSELGEQTYSGYFATVRDSIRKREGWDVSSDVFLGSFAYNKLAMWQDLERLRISGVRHPLILDLAAQQQQDGTPPDTQADVPSPLPKDTEMKGGKLDDLLQLRDQTTVLQADFSQLQAIESARTGHNLVIHGPPGTGKSQTITNIISALIAEGKRVLFVSEKRAALDVVKRNLEKCDLGVFCLDLHSEHGRRDKVYQQLKDSVSADRQFRPQKAERIQELTDLRGKLNEFTRALHKPRQPFGRSVFDVAGVYAAVQHLPAVDLAIAWIAELDEEKYSSINQLTNRLAQRGKQFREHESSPWLPLRTTDFRIGLADEIARDAQEVQQELYRVQGMAPDTATNFGLTTPISGLEVKKLHDICTHLAAAPGIPGEWLQVNRLAEIRADVKSAESLCDDWRQLRPNIEDLFGIPDEWPDFRQFRDQLDSISKTSSYLERLYGDDWSVQAIRRTGVAVSALKRLEASLQQLSTDTATLSDLLGGLPSNSWEEVSYLMYVATQVVALCPVPEQWLTKPAAVTEELRRTRRLAEELRTKQAEFGETCSKGLVSHVDAELAVRYRTDHQGIFRWFRPQYWRDQRLIKGHLREPRRLSIQEALTYVDRALEIQSAQHGWSEQETCAADLLGGHFRGLDTDWDAAEGVLKSTEKLLSSWPGDFDYLSGILAEPNQVRGIRASYEAVSRGLGEVSESIISLRDEASLKETHGVEALLKLVQVATPQQQTVDSAVRTFLPSVTNHPATFPELAGVFANAARLIEVQEAFQSASSGLASLLRERFRGYDTDWQNVRDAIEWADHLIGLVSEKFPLELVAHAERPQRPTIYQEWARSLTSTIPETLTRHFDESMSRWGTWLAAPFRELAEWTRYLIDNSREAADWTDFRRACQQAEDLFGPVAINRVRHVTDNASLIPGIVGRAVSSAWIDHMCASDTHLAEFSVTNHRAVRKRFRELDQSFPLAVREEVRRLCFERYPQRSSSQVGAGQIGVLYHELSKKRRRMPVRKLLERVPTLIANFKPCFLMSPLAVSQYLPLEEGGFDAVIFDEASQVFPEDAVPSIVRGQQVIVVGDPKQLPPTSFFRRAEADDVQDEDWEDEDDQLVGMESILDAMVGLAGSHQVGEQYLRVHYRSRSEVLIQFSNQKFYSERPLLVFPDPRPPRVSPAIRRHYVPDGVYELGKRINPVEADKVVDLVFEMMERFGEHQSVGVVALSRAQADYLQERIDIRRETARHLDPCFSDDLPESFFVKNLENVQGDERDHVILGIGYGPLVPGGKPPNRFGPINRQGGERRLNVAISRARETMTVVHSLRSSDITSPSEGAKLLRAYLEYVANPVDFFAREVQSSPDAEAESPFEEAVIAALRGRGYEIDPQVGVAGYRVDIGVLSDDRSSYILGIECDGYTYHATPAARDRDWLRQSILEGLGWKIHRVWSTAWIQNPSAEIAGIENAIQQAKVDQQQSPSLSQQKLSVGKREEQNPNELVESETVKVEVSESAKLSVAFEDYRQADLRDVPVDTSCDLQVAGILTLRPLIERVVEVEMPIRSDEVANRIREYWGLRRTGHAIWERVESAVQVAVREGIVAWDKTTTERKIAHRSLVLPSVPIKPRRPRPGDSPRPIDQIAESEIASGLLAVVDAIHGGNRDEIVILTAREFGYRRTGGTIESRIGRVLDGLVQEKQLREVQDLLLRSVVQQ